MAPQLLIRPLRNVLLRVKFSDDVVRSKALLSTDNYQITPTNGGDAIAVRAVFTDGSKTPSYVDIETDRPTLGAKYQLNISSLETPNGVEFTDTFDFFISKKTKTDAMLGSMSQMYDTSIRSNISNLILAIGIIDEQIGGQGDLLPKSVTEEEDIGSIWGGENWGDAIW